tara:strand:- start:926 stop:1849 length:924 start_codon:yes stop_codon:yes gene_type:complete
MAATLGVETIQHTNGTTAVTVGTNGSVTAAGAVTAGTGTFTGNLTANGGVVFNEGSADVDFRVESNGNTNMLIVDGENDRVGIGRSGPQNPFEVHLDTNKNIGFSGGMGEIGSVPGIVAYIDAGALTDIGFRGTTIRFADASKERMRIASDGKLQFNSQGASQITMQATSSGAHIFTAYDFRNSSAASVGNIAVGTSSTAYNTSSDYRLKENVDYTWDATARLKQLKPARFNFITDADTTVDGFIAHEAQTVVPESVTGTKDAVDEDGVAVMQGMDNTKLVPLLVKALQELSAKNDALEARITALEA